MKKLIATISAVVIISTTSILSIWSVKELKESVHNYINNDLVGNSDDIDYEPIETAQSQAGDDKKSEVINSTTDNSETKTDTAKSTGNDKSSLPAEKNSYTDTIDNEANTEEAKNLADTDLYENKPANSSQIKNDITGKQQTADESNLTKEELYENTKENNEKEDKTDNAEPVLNTMVGSSFSAVTDVKGDETDLGTEAANKKQEVWAALDITNPSIKVQAASAVLMNENEKIIFHKNALKKVYPASTTKLMTALVSLEWCNLTDEVTIGEEINKIASDSSRAYLKVGEKLTFQMLLEGMLLPSGNDAAYSAAVFAGRKSLNNPEADIDEALEEFIRLMNEKSKEIGLYNTNFKNPDGYDAEGQYTTAYDMGIIALKAIKNESIASIVSEASVRNVFLSGEDVTWYSGNKLIRSGSGVYYPYAVGLKTGTSSKAGRCLVSAAEKDGKLYISVIMNSTAAGRWEDSIQLLKYGLENKR